MMVIISYDVATSDPGGKKRLRKVAKECQNHAQRVQNSVFEADLDYSAFLKLKERLLEMIDKEKEQIQFEQIKMLLGNISMKMLMEI